MSVLQCARPDCENIMCDHLYEPVGYVCDECIEEFRQAMYSKGVVDDFDWPMQIFMGTPKGFYKRLPGVKDRLERFIKSLDWREA